MADAELIQQLLIDIQKSKITDEAKIKLLKSELVALEESIIGHAASTKEVETRMSMLQAQLADLKLEKETLRLNTADLKAAIVDPLEQKVQCLNAAAQKRCKAELHTNATSLSYTISSLLQSIGFAGPVIADFMGWQTSIGTDLDDQAVDVLMSTFQPRQFVASFIDLPSMQTRVESELEKLRERLAKRAKEEAEKALRELFSRETDEKDKLAANHRKGFDILSRKRPIIVKQPPAPEAASCATLAVPDLPLQQRTLPGHSTPIDISHIHVPFDSYVNLDDECKVPSIKAKKSVRFAQSEPSEPTNQNASRNNFRSVLAAPTSVLNTIVTPQEQDKAQPPLKVNAKHIPLSGHKRKETQLTDGNERRQPKQKSQSKIETSCAVGTNQNCLQFSDSAMDSGTSPRFYVGDWDTEAAINQQQQTKSGRSLTFAPDSRIEAFVALSSVTEGVKEAAPIKPIMPSKLPPQQHQRQCEPLRPLCQLVSNQFVSASSFQQPPMLADQPAPAAAPSTANDGGLKRKAVKRTYLFDK